MQHIGVARLPAQAAHEVAMWAEVQAFATELRAEQWMLIGGQMVAVYAAWAGQDLPRVTRDVDILANMEVLAGNLQACTAVLTRRGFISEPDSRGTVYRFRPRIELPNAAQVRIDLAAPDRVPPALARFGGPVFQVDAGTQALRRAVTITVEMMNGERFDVPVPGLLGAIVLKAAAWAADQRDPARHAQDAALLVSLVDDPEGLRAQFAGSDARRLRGLGRILDDPLAEPWVVLDGSAREAGRDNWLTLRS